MSDRLTLATSTGLPFLSLAFHVGTGLIALAAGFLAIAARKGGKWHRRSGLVFVYSMIATGITAAGIAAYEGKPTVVGGALTAYLVFTAWTAVKPLPGVTRRVEIALVALAFALAAAEYTFAFTALGRPGNNIDGVPAGMMFFMATIVLLAAIPTQIRIVPLIFVLALSPLVLLLYWMWRIRLRRNLRGLMTAKALTHTA